MADTNRARVTVVGSFNVDHAWQVSELPEPGETRTGTYRSGPGGKGFNQATAAVRAGADTTFVCALGNDTGGGLARRLAETDGIDLRAQECDQPTGTAGILIDHQGGNSIVVAAGANGCLSPDFVARQRDAITASGIMVAQLESPTAAIRRAFELARAANVTTLLNPAPVDAEIDDALWALADIVTPNESEFCGQLQRRDAGSLAAADVADCQDARLHALCRALAPLASVVVTLGAAGCFVSHPPHRLRGDTAPCYRVDAVQVDCRDTTGAGDAFNGALAAAIAGSSDPTPFVEHVRFATRYAALSTEVPGAADAMPFVGDIEKRFGPAT